jgi:protein-S-isoprenylcysteine O-methyltransferase Ste14
MAESGWKSFERSKLYDLAAALPLIAFYGWGVWRNWPRLVDHYFILRFGYVDARVIAETMAILLTILFSTLLVLLLLVRVIPAAKSGGLVPRFAAVIGTFLVVALVWLSPARLPAWLAIVSVALILFGTLASIVCLIWLGRSFSILPEARRLVTGGPYLLVRHPLYLFEEIAVFGIMLQHLQPWSFLIFAAQFGFQLARIHFEEQVLSAHFPGYKAYAAGRARLIPGVY